MFWQVFIIIKGPIAQLNRVSDFGSDGCRFESYWGHQSTKKTMIAIGKFNNLKVVKQLSFGLYLDGKEQGEILMPTRYIPENTQIGDVVCAFIYFDSDDKLIATTEKPYAQVGEFAYLEVIAINKIGAFLNWGLTKDLLVPFREQKTPLKEKDFTWVYIYQDDKTQRITATTKIDKKISKNPPPFKEKDKINILIYKKTDLGYKVIINQSYEGMIYKNEIFKPLNIGDTMQAYIKQIRTDNKIDVSLYKTGYIQVLDFTPILLDAIRNNNGYLNLTDKSSSEIINTTFGVSKKTFKKAVGDLYKKQYITIKDDGLYIVS